MSPLTPNGPQRLEKDAAVIDETKDSLGDGQNVVRQDAAIQPAALP
ncbi:hypothetical protein [Ferrimicrobium sp.]|nr:hypothetical protein [Ferrimicrobium sp.]